MSSERSRFPIIPVLLVALGILLIGGAAIVIFVPGLELSNKPSTATSEMIPYPQIKRVPLADAKTAFDQGTAIFVDVRGDPFYSQEHIPGALSIPERDLIANLDKLDPQAWIILYCT